MVTVLLAVYNGEKYLKSQIDSLLDQTFKEIKIIIRDDGSNDNSTRIIAEYCKNYPQIISTVEGVPTGNAARNFARLLEVCDDDYIMFCDQDDIWLPEKIEKTLEAVKSQEGKCGEIPVLAHSDLKVVDQNLNVISDSFFNFQKLCQDNVTLPRLLTQNYVTGCTVMINRALKEKCGTIPPSCIMHDWWLALVAVLFGKIICLKNPTILYRQHSGNQVGAKSAYGVAFIKRKLATLDKVRENYSATYTQAAALIDCYRNVLSAEHRHILEVYCSMQNMNKINRIRIIRKYDFKKGTRLRVIGQYLLM